MVRMLRLSEWVSPAGTDSEPALRPLLQSTSASVDQDLSGVGGLLAAVDGDGH
jgi:hypothetical protein